MSRRTLHDAINDAEPTLPPPIASPAAVVEATAKAFGLSVETLVGRDRDPRVVEARHVAIALVYTLSQLSYGDTARVFDQRDHTTVMASVARTVRSKRLSSLARGIRDQLEAT